MLYFFIRSGNFHRESCYTVVIREVSNSLGSVHMVATHASRHDYNWLNSCQACNYNKSDFKINSPSFVDRLILLNWVLELLWKFLVSHAMSSGDYCKWDGCSSTWYKRILLWFWEEVKAALPMVKQPLFIQSSIQKYLWCNLLHKSFYGLGIFPHLYSLITVP